MRPLPDDYRVKDADTNLACLIGILSTPTRPTYPSPIGNRVVGWTMAEPLLIQPIEAIMEQPFPLMLFRYIVRRFI